MPRRHLQRHSNIKVKLFFLLVVLAAWVLGSALFFGDIDFALFWPVIAYFQLAAPTGSKLPTAIVALIQIKRGFAGIAGLSVRYGI